MSAGIKFHKVTHFFNPSKLPHIGGPLVRQAQEFVSFNPEKPLDFKIYLKLNSSFDIPYLLGYDTKNDIAYGDKDFDIKSFSKGDASQPLLSHEQIEKELEHFPDASWNYEQRHHVATHCENLIVDALKWNWREYSRWTTENWHKSYAKWRKPSGLKCPPTLDMSPYSDEHEGIISAMRKAGAEDAGRES